MTFRRDWSVITSILLGEALPTVARVSCRDNAGVTAVLTCGENPHLSALHEQQQNSYSVKLKRGWYLLDFLGAIVRQRSSTLSFSFDANWRVPD